MQRTLGPSIALDASAMSPPDSLAVTPSGRLPTEWPGGDLTLTQCDGDDDSRTLRAWPSGAIETVDP